MNSITPYQYVYLTRCSQQNANLVKIVDIREINNEIKNNQCIVVRAGDRTFENETHPAVITNKCK